MAAPAGYPVVTPEIYRGLQENIMQIMRDKYAASHGTQHILLGKEQLLMAYAEDPTLQTQLEFWIKEADYLMVPCCKYKPMRRNMVRVMCNIMITIICTKLQRPIPEIVVGKN